MDWDESNAFCNVERAGLARLLEDHPEVDCGQWMCHFDASLEVFVVTPFGLTGSYELLHGVVQGDGMGVGSFTLVGVFRSRGVRPRAGDRRTGRPSPSRLLLLPPGLP